MTADLTWWSFDLPGFPSARERPDKTSVCSASGVHSLDYRTYLSLPTLLSCQAPLSTVPDERAFIVTHQLIELVLKLMIFDLAVVATTIRKVTQSATTPQELQNCLDHSEFWRQGLSASSRLQFSCKTTLPLLSQYVDVRADGISGNLDREGFFGFRNKLGNASGMQSAQFRLVQRALGKSPLLELRVFPKFRVESACGQQLIAVTDPSILREDKDVASPKDDSILADVAQLDDLVHTLLAKFAVFNPHPVYAGIPSIADSEFENAVIMLEKVLAQTQETVAASRLHAESMHCFRVDLRQLIDDENARRVGCGTAAAGAGYLKARRRDSPFVQILKHLSAADYHLHGQHRQSFLSRHLSIARNALQSPQTSDRALAGNKAKLGTGGGSIAYLRYMCKYLVPLFPAMIAFRKSAAPCNVQLNDGGEFA